MSEQFLQVAGRTVPIHEAMEATQTYPTGTIKWYDCAGDASPPEPTPGVALEDLGRLALIEPRLSGNDANGLLEFQPTSGWPVGQLDLRDEASAFGGAAYGTMSALWADLTGRRGIGRAKASKILHLKQPAFVPILDRFVRNLYDETARSFSDDGKTPLFWAAIRRDLIASTSALAELRAHLDEADPHERRVRALTDLRLFDIVMWSVAKREALG